MSIALALEIAEKAHRGQKRYREAFTVLTSSGLKSAKKKTEPFILHPMRVALNVYRVAPKMSATPPSTLEKVQQVAILHDVVEDTAWSVDDLRSAGFAPADGWVAEDVARLTRSEEESYAEYIQRISEGPMSAIVVKIADLLDNLDGYTLGGEFADVSLVKRYRKALAQLGWSGREAKR